MLNFVTCYLVVFIFSDYKNLYLPSILHLYRLYNVFRENKDSKNCAQLVEEEIMKILNENSCNDDLD